MTEKKNLIALFIQSGFRPAAFIQGIKKNG